MFLILNLSAPVSFAGNLPDEQVEDEIEDVPLPFSWDGDAYLTAGGFSTIATDNNFFSATLTIYNSNASAGAVIIKVTSTGGFSDEVTIQKGNTGYIEDIPWNAGKYTVSAKAVATTGWYSLDISD
jgi:hypothetical protein